MRFKCKYCGKFIMYDDEDKKDVICEKCGTVHAWLYENGWGYVAKDFVKKKCPVCKEPIHIPREKVNKSGDEEHVYSKIQCEACGEELMLISWYSNLRMVPFTTLVFKCEWCENSMEIDISDTNELYINQQTSNPIIVKDEVCRCEKCRNKTRIHYWPFWQETSQAFHYTRRVPKSGRKRKLDVDEDEVFNCLEIQGYEIFWALTREEISNLNIEDYKTQFDKLILKEDAMTEAGGASLSSLIGSNSKTWQTLRKYMLEKDDYTCSVCGFKTENTKLLHVHENWKVKEKIVELSSVELICSRCHACKHRNQYLAFRVQSGQSMLDMGIPRIDMLTIHLMKVNKVEKEVIYAYRKKVLAEWDEKRMKEIEERIRGKNVDESIEYKYQIMDGIPCKESLEFELRKRELLN